ncbi:MAG TPA: hypothetical protein VIJ63_06345 [Roseiarcus sp.]
MAVNDHTGGPSIFYATADAPELARIFANQPLSPASPPTLFDIDIQTASGLVNYYDNQANLDGGEFATGIVVAVNAVDPSKLLFRSSRLYAWTDPGTPDAGNPTNQNCSSPSATCTIAVTDISSENLFNIDAWAQKIAYATQETPRMRSSPGVRCPRLSSPPLGPVASISGPSNNIGTTRKST